MCGLKKIYIYFFNNFYLCLQPLLLTYIFVCYSSPYLVVYKLK